MVDMARISNNSWLYVLWYVYLSYSCCGIPYFVWRIIWGVVWITNST